MFLPGNWRYDATDGTVRTTDGRIVAESVLPQDGALIACAPEMYEVLEDQRMLSANHAGHARLLAREIGAAQR